MLASICAGCSMQYFYAVTAILSAGVVTLLYLLSWSPSTASNLKKPRGKVPLRHSTSLNITSPKISTYTPPTTPPTSSPGPPDATSTTQQPSPFANSALQHIFPTSSISSTPRTSQTISDQPWTRGQAARARVSDMLRTRAVQLGCPLEGSHSMTRSMSLTAATWQEASRQMHTGSPSTVLPRKMAYSDAPENEGKVQVLCVDDEPVNQSVVECMLAGCCEVVHAADGEEALEVIRTAPYLPDIVLLDIVLPGISGLEVCKELRQAYTCWELPVIMVTCLSSSADAQVGLAAGANDYVAKPLQMAELLLRINAQLVACSSSRVEAEAQASMALLGRMLPQHVIKRMEGGRRLIMESHKQVTVLVAKVRLQVQPECESRSHRTMVLLNDLYCQLDHLCELHGAFKVDATRGKYIAVCGHDSVEDHAMRLLRLASAIVALLEEGLPLLLQDEALDIRIGVHTGQAVSGVVGANQPRYHFYGQAVQGAQALCRACPYTCVLLSGATRALTLPLLAPASSPTLLDCSFYKQLPQPAGEPLDTFMLAVGRYEEALQQPSPLSEPSSPTRRHPTTTPTNPTPTTPTTASSTPPTTPTLAAPAPSALRSSFDIPTPWVPPASPRPTVTFQDTPPATHPSYPTTVPTAAAPNSPTAAPSSPVAAAGAGGTLSRTPSYKMLHGWKPPLLKSISLDGRSERGLQVAASIALDKMALDAAEAPEDATGP